MNYSSSPLSAGRSSASAISSICRRCSSSASCSRLLLTPWIGLLLSALTGSPRFFFETFAALLISSALIFLSGLLAGFAVRAFLPRTLNEAFLHSQLWWLDLIVLALGAVILTVSFVRSEDKPYLPSVMLAYELFLPLSASGFGLGSGVAGIWPNGMLVFLVHFAWAGLFGMVTLIALRFLPTNLNGFILSTVSLLIFVALLLFLMTGGNWKLPSLLRPGVPTSIPTLPTLTLNSPATSTELPFVQVSLHPADRNIHTRQRYADLHACPADTRYARFKLRLQ